MSKSYDWPVGISASKLSTPVSTFYSLGIKYKETQYFGLIRSSSNQYNTVKLYSVEGRTNSAYYYWNGNYTSTTDYKRNMTMVQYKNEYVKKTLAQVNQWKVSDEFNNPYTVANRWGKGLASNITVRESGIYNTKATEEIGNALLNLRTKTGVNWRSEVTSSRFKDRLYQLLVLNAGIPKAKVDELIKAFISKKLNRGSGGGGGGSGSNTPGGGGTDTTIGEVKRVVRAPFGYVAPALRSEPNVRPMIVQTYPTESSAAATSTAAPVSSTQQYAIERFVFPYIPNNIQYQGSTSEWVEIPREGDFPIVEWARHTLLKVSFEFLIAGQRNDNPKTGAIVPDGLFYSVSDQIETLRRMAQRPYPVSVLNMDHFLTVAMRRAQLTDKPLEFVISDFSFSATRRTQEEDSSEIAAASCRMTLQEIPIEEQNIVKFTIPVLAPKKTPKKFGSRADKPVPTTLLISEVDFDESAGTQMQTNAAGRMTTTSAKTSMVSQTSA